MFSASKSKGASGSYQIANSLRFRSSASAYLNRTPASASNRRVWTWSGWVKKGLLSGNYLPLFNAGQSIPDTVLRFTDTDAITAILENGGGGNAALVTSAVYRDPSAWYHIVWSVDTTLATADNRSRLYVNGVEITAFSTRTNPTQNLDTNVNNTVQHRIGGQRYSSYFDGYLADINFIDGQALTPSSFGQISTVTGVWQPIAYTGTYGTNGFKLNFSNGTSTTTLGYDSSGNGNNWTTNNISLTAGSTYDWMIDSPTPFAGTSYGVGNYAVLNPLKSNSAAGLTQGNLYQYIAIANWTTTVATIGISSGKWYWEQVYTNITTGSFGMAGIVDGSFSIATANYPGITATSYGYFNYDGKKYNNATPTAYGASYTNNDIIGVALDLDVGTLTFYKNNTSQGIAFTGLSGTFFPALSTYGSVAEINFGQRPFAYTPPSGYKSLCTYNLPTPTIQNGANYMAATTYTGTGSSLSVVNTGFQPDFVWIKSRSAATDHALYDVIRGTQDRLESNTTDAEVTSDNGLTAFGTSGFTVNTLAQVNTNTATYVGWQWKAGGTAVTNTAGSITSQVSANTTSGFSVVTWTGNGTGGSTIGHGLGVAPSFVISKRRDSADDWSCYHVSLGGTKYIDLNSTAAAGTSIVVWNNTNPSSTVVTLGTSNRVNGSGGTYVAYCFAAIAGYSAFGSYTGNGSADGPFVYCGFRPRFILYKRTDTTGDWYIFDTSRSSYNAMNNVLFPNASNVEDTGGFWIDALSNGFKQRGTGANSNASGGTYIYAAFAENPFTNSLAR